MTVRLAEPAVIAAHSRLDDAHAVIDLATREDLEDDVAGVMAGLKAGTTDDRRTVVVLGFSRALWPAQMPFYGFTNECTDVLFVHTGRSTVSTMPTIAASTGAAFLPIASLAARPSRTMSTFSCTPAPTPSTAS